MLKLEKALLLSAFTAPVLGNALSVDALNDSLCSSVVTPTSRGAYLISKLAYEEKGNHYFVQKNKMFFSRLCPT